MKIYVDEIPKTCDECKLKQVINKTKDGLYTSYQCPFKDGELAFGDNPYRRKCPLHPVAEREAEVRKEVVGEIRELIKLYYLQNKDCLTGLLILTKRTIGQNQALEES